MAPQPLPKLDCRGCLVWSPLGNEGDLYVTMFFMKWLPEVTNIMNLRKHCHNPPFFAS